MLADGVIVPAFTSEGGHLGVGGFQSAEGRQGQAKEGRAGKGGRAGLVRAGLMVAAGVIMPAFTGEGRRGASEGKALGGLPSEAANRRWVQR